MKRIPHPPTWLPGVLHLAHGLIAGGAAYLLAYAATILWHSAPWSTGAIVASLAAFGLAVFEGGFLVYWIARRRRIRRLWRDAARYLKLDRHESAEAALLELSAMTEYRLSPQPVLFALGAALEGKGDERGALVMYRRCGDFVPALRATGMLQLRRGLHEAAADAFRKIVVRHPGDVLATVLLALALVRGGNQGAAVKVLRRALEKRPNSAILKVNLSRVESGEEPAFEPSDAGLREP